MTDPEVREGSAMGPLILIAEPEAETRTFLKTLLEREGYEVCPAACADTAITEIPSRRPCLVIVDALLPDDGAARLVRHCHAIPVILTSAIPMKSLVFRQPILDVLHPPGGPSMPVPFLEKPLQEDELFGLIRSLMHQEGG
jgi:CheY-like chemotaxis protein